MKKILRESFDITFFHWLVHLSFSQAVNMFLNPLRIFPTWMPTASLFRWPVHYPSRWLRNMMMFPIKNHLAFPNHLKCYLNADVMQGVLFLTLLLDDISFAFAPVAVAATENWHLLYFDLFPKIFNNKLHWSVNKFPRVNSATGISWPIWPVKRTWELRATRLEVIDWLIIEKAINGYNTNSMEMSN